MLGTGDVDGSKCAPLRRKQVVCLTRGAVCSTYVPLSSKQVVRLWLEVTKFIFEACRWFVLWFKVTRGSISSARVRVKLLPVLQPCIGFSELHYSVL